MSTQHTFFLWRGKKNYRNVLGENSALSGAMVGRQPLSTEVEISPFAKWWQNLSFMLNYLPLVVDCRMKGS